MRYFYVRAMVAKFLALSAAGVLAQGQGGRAGGDSPNEPTYLLASESVEQELALSDEQKLRLQRLREQEEQRARTFFRGMIGMSQEQIQAKLDKRANVERAKIEKVLTPEQMRRLNEINVRAAGVTALGFDEVAEELALTADQRTRLRALGDDSRRQLMELYANDGAAPEGQAGNERKQKQEEIVAARARKAMAVLTKEQKEKLAKLQGDPFDVSTIKPRQRNFSNRGRIEAPPVPPVR
jgi:hypothetical protein